jgi:hypothetical protein
MRIALLVLAVGNVHVGIWATFAPRSFYDDFPGYGRHWVRVDGPYNRHLVSDFGTINLALAVVTIAAAFTLSRPHVIAVALAWLISGLLHFNYHLHHLDVFSSTNDQVIGGAFLGAVPILALAVMVLAVLSGGRTAPPEP